MELTGLDLKKQRLQQKIHCYGKRKRGGLANKTLNRWKNSLKLIHEGQKQAKMLANHVIEFNGIMDKRLFIKYGLENGIKAEYLQWWCCQAHKSYIYMMRKNFIKSFSTKPENLIVWKSFSRFMEEQKQENDQITGSLGNKERLKEGA